MMVNQESVESLQRRIEAQGRRIEFLEGKNQQLQEENDTLKNSLTGQTVQAERTYQDNRVKFDQIGNLILETIVYLCKTYQKPCDYEQIIKTFQYQNPFINAKTETITRRVRELKANGFLHSPSPGTFVPIPKVSQ